MFQSKSKHTFLYDYGMNINYYDVYNSIYDLVDEYDSHQIIRQLEKDICEIQSIIESNIAYCDSSIKDRSGT